MRTSSIALVLLLVPMIASAQTGEFRPGARTRVEAPGLVAGKFEGTVLSVTADSVVLGSEASAPFTIPRAKITSVEISRGKSRAAGALRGAPWGLGFGVVFGLAAMNDPETVCSSSSNYASCTRSLTSGQKAEFVTLMAVGSTIWGAIIGSAFPVESWSALSLPASTRVTIANGKPTVGMSLSF